MAFLYVMLVLEFSLALFYWIFVGSATSSGFNQVDYKVFNSLNC